MTEQLRTAGGTGLARGQMWILSPLDQGDGKNWWFGQKEEIQIRRWWTSSGLGADAFWEEQQDGELIPVGCKEGRLVIVDQKDMMD